MDLILRLVPTLLLWGLMGLLYYSRYRIIGMLEGIVGTRLAYVIGFMTFGLVLALSAYLLTGSFPQAPITG